MSLKNLLVAVILVSFSVELLALSSGEDTRYLLLERRKISSDASLIESKAVVSRLSCAAHCNINQECSHFSINTPDATVCELYRTVETSSNAEDAGVDSYFRLNPFGTVAKDYLLHLEPLVPYGKDEILWQQAAGDGDHNLELPDVRNLQMCYEICIAFTKNHCWVFSYVDKEERCIVPNLYGQMFNHGVREGFGVEAVSGAEVYMHNRVLVDNSYDNLLADASFFFVNNSHLYKGDDFADRLSNLRMPGIDNEQYCYRICLVTNNGTCTMFSYSRELQMCVIPHGDGHTLMQALYLTKDEQYETFMFDEDYPQELTDQTTVTFVDSVFHIGDGSYDLANNRNFSLVSTAQDCFTMCLMTNNGSCLSFSYSEMEENCIVPHTLIMEDLGQELTDDYLTTTIVNGFTTTLGTHLYITIPNFISYQGSGSHDDVENRKFGKVATTQDCYTLCLKTNENYCLEYSYSTSQLTCVIPHDTGNLNVDTFGQEEDFDYFTNVFTVYTDTPLPLHITLTNVIYHKGSSADDSLNNFMMLGVTSSQHCYAMCLERNENHCFAYSYSSAELTCVILNDDGTTHLDDIDHDATSGYLTYRFNDYTEASLPAYLTLSDVIYRKGDGPYDARANFWTPGVESIEDCYTLCLDRNDNNCFSFSYHSTEKVCIVLHDDGTAHLDDITPDVSTGYTTYRFNGYTAATLPLYLSLSNVIYHKGSSHNDNSSNFVSPGVTSKEDCYRLTLDRNDNHDFAFSYSATDKICVVLHDDGSTQLDDITTYQSTGYTTYRFNSYTQETLPAHIILSNVIYRRGISADDTSGNFKTHGVGSYEDCYRLCLDRNDNTCFGFSYSSADLVCVVPHDGGAHLDDLSKDVASGYYTYLFNDYTDAAVPAYLTLTDVIYHKGSSYSDNSSNFVSPGVDTMEDCYTLCLDRNENNCFAMSYSSAGKICVILHDDGSTHLDDITTLESSGYSTYRFNSYAQSSLTAHIVLSNVLYRKATVDPAVVTNFVTQGVGSPEDCYRLCLDRNDNKCFFFSYSLSEKECVVLHDDGSTHLDDVTVDDASGFHSYLFNDFTTRSLPLYITLSDVIYHKGSTYDDADSNFVTPGVESVDDCYTLCLDRNEDHCFGFSYSSTDDKKCVVLRDDGGSTKLDDITTAFSPGYTTYLFNDFTTRSLPLYITLSDVIYHKGSTYDDSDNNFVTPGVESVDDCYTLCLDRNEDHCFGFSYSSTGDKECVVLHDDGGSTKLDDITTDVTSGYTTYLFNDYTDTSLALNIILTNVVYHKGTSVDDSSANFKTPGVGSHEDCYTLCLDRNVNKCFGFSYSLSDKMCVVPHDESGTTTLDHISSDVNSGYSTYLFNDFTTRSIPVHVTLSNVIYHKGSASNDDSSNFISPGVESYDDCYTLCLDSNGDRCFAFSYSTSDKICIALHDDGSTGLDNTDYEVSSGYETYRFNSYTQTGFQPYITISSMIYHKGTSADDSTLNFKTKGVNSDIDCYRLCLDRNSNYCFGFSYSSADKVCVVPHDDGGSTTLDHINRDVTSGYTTYLFNDYTATSLSAHITLSDITYYKGTSADGSDNFKSEGVASYEDCYTLCLDRNDNKCFSFSYSLSATTCVVPHDDDGSTTLDDITTDVTPGYTTYIFNDYTTTSLDPYITLNEVIYHKGTSPDDDTANFKTQGVGSYEDCYTLCLDRNGGNCFAFSYSSSDDVCYALHSTADTHLNHISNQTTSGFTTYLFIDYTSNILTNQHRLSLDEVIYYKGSSVADSDDNFITTGVGSEQNCYSICMDRNEGSCFSFSYSSGEKICRVPHDTGSTLITDVIDIVDSGYVTLLLTSHAASALSSRTYVTLNDVIYEQGVNFEIAGATTLQHCYSICLLRNSGNCFSFSFSLGDKTCSLPVDSANTDLDDITNTTSLGYQTISFNSHTGSALTSRNRVVLDGVIYYGGTNEHDSSDNFVSDGVGDEQTCYLLCMERNGGNCFSLSYSSASDRCRFPHSSSSTLIKDIPDTSVSEYTTYLLTDHSTSSMSSNTYVTLSTVKYVVGSNFQTRGVTSLQDCYVICLVRNAGQCFSFSYKSSVNLCSIVVVTSSTDLDDVDPVNSDEFDTYYYTGYTANTLTSVHRFSLSSIGLHKGTDIADDSANFISSGVTSEQDCYTMCLARNGGHCLAFAYKNSENLCVAAHDGGSSTIQQYTQYSNVDYYSVVTAADYSTSLSSRSHITLADYIYYLGNAPDDSTDNFVLNGVASSENCHTACLLYNQGSCNAYSYGDQICNIPNANSDLIPSDFSRQSNSAYDTVYFTGSYHASHPSSYIVTSDSKWSRSTSSQNFELDGVGSTSDCYIGCYTENQGYCYIYSYHSSSKTCYFTLDSGTKYIHDMTQTTDSGYSSYYFLRNEYNLALSSIHYFTLTNRLLHYGPDYDDASDNYAITGVGSLEDCYKFALMENSGSKISFSWSSSSKKCYVPIYQSGDYGIESMEQTSLSGYTTAIFESAHTASLPSHMTTSNRIIYKGSSYTESSSNFILYGVTSAQDCYTACLIRNEGRCIAFTYKSDECIIPLDTGSLNVDDLDYTSSSGYTIYTISNGYGMISNYATISNYFYSKGLGSESLHEADSYTHCAILCQLVNNGRCISFSYNGATCRIPYDSGNLHAEDLTAFSSSGYTTYLVVRDSSDNDISFSSYSTMPSQYVYLGSSHTDSDNNEQWVHVVSSAADCYRMCYLRNGLNCKVFSYATNNCLYPMQSGISRISDVKVVGHGSWTTYFMFSTSSRSESFPSGSYSYLSNLKIRDGRQGSIYEIYFSGVSDVHRCYRLCLESFSTCRTFSYDTGTDYCYLTSVNFHSEWTYVESDSACTGYFLKNSGSWKLITKHRQYQNVLPDNAFQHTGSYHTIVPSGDLSASSSFTTNGNLKNNLIDHWDSLSSRYRIRMVLRNSGGSELRYLQFNVGSATKTNWFSSTYFSASSWSDLTSSVTHDHWSMGDTYRTFYISRHHNGCQGDNGWIVISASTNQGCSEFDRTSTVPKFVYSPHSTSVNWYNNNYATAEVLTIYMSFS